MAFGGVQSPEIFNYNDVRIGHDILGALRKISDVSWEHGRGVFLLIWGAGSEH